MPSSLPALLLLMGACGVAETAPASTPPAPPPSEPDGTPMLLLTIQDASDVTPVTQQLRQAALDGVTEATVQITAERTDGLNLQLGQSSSAPPMAITVKGPAVLERSHVAVQGTRVTIEDLTFVRAPGSGDALSVTATEAIALRDLAFLGHTTRSGPSTKRRGAKTSGRPVALWAKGPETAVSLERVVVADGSVQPAVALGGKPGGRFKDVVLSEVVLAGMPTPVVHVSAAVSVSIDGVLSDAPAEAVHVASPAILVLGDAAPLAPDHSLLETARSAVATEAP